MAGGFSVARYAPERGSWAKLTARDSLARRLDWPLLGAALALSCSARSSSGRPPATVTTSPRATRTSSSSGTP